MLGGQLLSATLQNEMILRQVVKCLFPMISMRIYGQLFTLALDCLYPAECPCVLKTICCNLLMVKMLCAIMS